MFVSITLATHFLLALALIKRIMDTLRCQPEKCSPFFTISKTPILFRQKIKVQSKYLTDESSMNCLEWFGWSPRISNSWELKLTLGLREKMNKKLLNAKEWYSYGRKPLGRSCGLWYKENSVNKTLKELEPWKQNYPIGVEANNNAKRKEAGENKYPAILFSCLQISFHVSW